MKNAIVKKRWSAMPRSIILILSATCFSIVRASASDSTATAIAQTTWNAFVDVYYTKNFNDPIDHTNQLRNFDIHENQFILGLADLTVQKQAQPVGFKIELGFGTNNDVVQGGVTTTLSNVLQAYGTVVIPVGSGLTVDVGKFVTHMGYEVIASQNNWNYSRSYLFAFAIPYYHTGVRFSYPVVSNFTLGVHVVNGWNSNVDDNKFLSLGATLNYSMTSTTDIIFNGMWGHENLTPIENGARDVYDFILTQQLSNSLSLAANADYGQAGTVLGLVYWKGIALYGRWILTPQSAISLRAEVYYDPADYTTGVSYEKATFHEYTLTYEYHPLDPLLIRIEARDDFANGDAFNSASGLSTKRSQPTVTVGIITMF
jgi:hypothetical protein